MHGVCPGICEFALAASALSSSMCADWLLCKVRVDFVFAGSAFDAQGDVVVLEHSRRRT
jgi:hypothetical protein